jgi:hypothetical protein
MLRVLKHPRGGVWQGHSLRSFPLRTPPPFLQAMETYGFLYRACKNVITAGTFDEFLPPNLPSYALSMAPEILTLT